MKRIRGVVECGEFHSSQHFETAFRNFEEQFQRKQLCDVVLIAEMDGTRISAHRNVLAATSEYFLAMFTGSLRESHEISGDTLQTLVNYLYRGSIELRVDNVEMILTTASLMQLNNVLSACFDFMISNWYPSKLLAIVQIAEKYRCLNDRSKVGKFIHQKYMEISQTKEFLEVSPELLCSLIANDDIIVQSEEDVFSSCLLWIEHDRVNREKFIHQILSLIRLPLLPASFITTHVNPLCKSAECKDLIIEAMQWHLEPKLRSQMSTSRTKPRTGSAGSLLALKVVNKDIQIQRYCPEKDAWTEWKTLPNRFKYVPTILGDNLFILEACHPSKPMGGFESVDLKTLKVKSLKPLNTPRVGMACAVLEDCVYVVGGWDIDNQILSSVERWTPLTNTWTYVAPMSEPKFGTGVAVLNELLYAVGGGASCVIGTLECYDPKTNKWSTRAPMNVKRQWTGVTAGWGFLYAISGWTGNRYANSVERYDPIADKWTLICSLSNAVQQIDCAFLGQRLFAIGGYANEKKWCGAVEEYDFEKDQWTKKNALNGVSGKVHLLNIPPNIIV